MKDGWQVWAASPFVRFPFYVLKRFQSDKATSVASALSFATLLALVPLFSMIFAVLSLVPAFHGLFDELQSVIFETLLPRIGEQVTHQFKVFVENANTISGVSFFVLLVTIHMVISNVVDAFNAIWRVREPRPFLMRFLAKWTILFAGPLLIGASITLSSIAFAKVEWAGIETYTEAIYLSEILPLITAVVGFSALYFFLPARPVRLLDAFCGGLVAGLFFDLLKSLFGVYLRHFPSYEVIYGALATIPVVLVWTYLLWLVVLFGAELAAALPEWRAGVRTVAERQDLAQRLAAALHIFRKLSAPEAPAGGMAELGLREGLPIGPGQFGEVLLRLRTSGFLRRRWGLWSLRRGTGEILVKDLDAALGLSLDDGRNWPADLRRLLDSWLSDFDETRDLTLEAVLARAPARPAAVGDQAQRT